MSLAERLEEAANMLPEEADAIRPANGDPATLIAALDASGAARVLGWLLANDPSDAEELAESWLEAPGGPEAIAGVDDSELSKAGRKVLRRIHHRARTRGIDVPATDAAHEARVSRVPRVDAPLAEAYVAPFDPRGARLVYLMESSPSGGARVFEALLDGHRGVVDFQVYRSGRSAIRSFIRDVKTRPQFPTRSAQPDDVRALIAVAADLHPADRPFPRAFEEWRARVLAGVDATRTPGHRARANWLASGGEAAEDDRLLERIREGALGPWPTDDRDCVEAAVSALRDAAKSGESADLEARLEVAVGEVMNQLYGADERALCATRLDEMAWLYQIDDDPSLAGTALRMADALRGDDSRAERFVRALTETVLEGLLVELRASADETGAAVDGED